MIEWDNKTKSSALVPFSSTRVWVRPMCCVQSIEFASIDRGRGNSTALKWKGPPWVNFTTFNETLSCVLDVCEKRRQREGNGFRVGVGAARDCVGPQNHPKDHVAFHPTMTTTEPAHFTIFDSCGHPPIRVSKSGKQQVECLVSPPQEKKQKPFS